jgi:hypothetical protein
MSRVLALLLLVAGTVHAAEPEPLWLAAREGRVSVTGHSIVDCHKTQVTITNRTKEKLSLELIGSYFEPPWQPRATVRTEERSNKPAVYDWIQPVGLGLLAAGSPVSSVSVSGGSTVSINVLSFCLEHDALSPDDRTVLTFALAEAPAPITSAIRAWRADPTRRPFDVQNDVWNAKPPPDLTNLTGLPPGTRRVLVMGGELYVLAGSTLFQSAVGELLGIATGVVDATADADSLHVAFPSSPLHPNRTKGPCVCRYHERHWQEELALDGPGRFLWAQHGAAILSDEKATRLFMPGEPARLVGGPDARVTGLADGALVLTRTATETRLERVAARGAHLKVEGQTIASVVSAAGAVGPALYVVDRAGALVRLVPGKPAKTLEVPADLGLTARAGVTCSKVLEREGGALLETSAGLVLLGPAGSSLLPSPARGTTVVTDLGSGQLYAWSGSYLEVYDASQKGWARVGFYASAR